MIVDPSCREKREKKAEQSTFKLKPHPSVIISTFHFLSPISIVLHPYFPPHHSSKTQSKYPDKPSDMSSGWVGPGAKSSPQNESELSTYKALKRRLEAEERDRRSAENERRASLGLKPSELPPFFFSFFFAFKFLGVGAATLGNEVKRR